VDTVVDDVAVLLVDVGAHREDMIQAVFVDVVVAQYCRICIAAEDHLPVILTVIVMLVNVLEEEVVAAGGEREH